MEEQQQQSKGVLLAIAIVLLWLAGLSFFIAFEGSTILGEQVPADSSGGASWIQAAIEGLKRKAQQRQEAGETT